jgi:cytochrome d ubiquinol oxidase subunit I
MLASTTVDLARAQFATTSIYHFLFVPLTLGLGPIVAIFQTLWYRTRNEAWLRLTRFFGTLFLINFAIGVATGLVQEFEIGMNWSVYSRFVGNVFGAPLAIEGLAAFFLESTFLGLWIFGWNRLSPRLHLATLWIAVAGTWLSAYFIIVANSWMQKPVGYKLVNNGTEAQLTSAWDLFSNSFALWAYGHVLLAGLTVGSAVVFGVSCWHLVRGRNQETFLRAAKVALIVLVPVAAINLWFGSHFGIQTTQAQPMKIAATEAQWDTCQPCAFSLFQIGGFTESDQKPSFSIEVPRLLSFLATGSFNGKVQGITPVQNQERQQNHNPNGNYKPPIESVYWSMRAMAYLGTLVFLVAITGAWFYRRRSLERHRWFLWTGVVNMFFPFLAAIAGWLLTELGRQPWIVQGLLETSKANSPSVSATWIGISLSAFVLVYVSLLVLDFWLMRHYARLDPAGGPLGAEAEPPEEAPVPAIG